MKGYKNILKNSWFKLYITNTTKRACYFSFSPRILISKWSWCCDPGIGHTEEKTGKAKTSILNCKFEL